MCQHPPQANRDFSAFCVTLRQQLVGSPFLDPPLAAALELLDCRSNGHGFTWFECEVAHLAFNSEDMHMALGASVLLSLWNGHLRSTPVAS